MAKADGTYMKEVAKIERQQLLILDDFGIQPFDAQSRAALMEIIEGLPDKLFPSMATHILTHQTKTIEFAFVFSQTTQSNGFDTVANFYSDFIGKVPDEVKPLKMKVSELIEEKMTELILSGNPQTVISSQHPISFFADHKIFYWNPGGLSDSRRAGN
jgi:hypothetical protein